MSLRQIVTRTNAARRLALVALLVGSLVAGWPAQAATAEGTLPHAGAGGPLPGLSDRAWDGILAQIPPAGALAIPGQIQKLTADDGTANDYFGFSTAVSRNVAVVGAWGDNSGQGAVYIFYRNANIGTPWVQARDGLLGGAAGDYFGWSVAIDGDTLVVGAPKRTVGSNAEEGTVYIYTRNRDGADAWGLVKTLTVEGGGAAYDHFGWSVSISGGTIAVGAPDSDGVSANRGATYIFARNHDGADNWGQVRKLMGGSVENGHFGYSVVIDGGAVAVGMPGDDVGLGHTDQGAAYIFARNQGGADEGRQLAKLAASDGRAGDTFGQSVALNGEIAIVGAPNDDANTGAAYVFGRNRAGADAWGQIRKLTADDGAGGDHFGGSVATTIDGDTVVVGARDADAGAGASQGAAYLFARNQSGSNLWGQLSKLVAAGGAAGDLFGTSVAISDNVLILGAYGNLSWRGAAHVFAGVDHWIRLRQVTADDGVAYDFFGHSAALSGATLAVGAYGVGDSEGAAYVMARNQDGADRWGRVQTLVISDTSGSDGFGYSVALSGDTLVVAAPADHVTYSDQGAVYVYARNWGGADAWGLVKRLTALDAAAEDNFGAMVAIDGDTIVVGSPKHDVAGKGDQGAAYIFARNWGGTADNWGQVAEITAADGLAEDNFGVAVDIDEDTVVVGAYKRDVSATDQGVAYIFARNQGGADKWGEVTGMLAEDAAEGDYFGAAVAIAGDTVVVGAPAHDVGGNLEQGAAYLFTRNRHGADHWDEVRQLTADDGAAEDHFGNFVTLDGNTVVAATPDDNSHQGAAYVFVLNQGAAYRWSQTQKLAAAVSDQFGSAVALSGNTLMVGARSADLGSNTAQGAVYLFVPGTKAYLPLITR